MVSRRPPSLDRVTIERMTPAIDAGRFAVKRIVGDRVTVSADIFKEGHELCDARLVYRGPSDPVWRTQPMAYDSDADRWSAEFLIELVGRWEYAVEAWPDTFRTWRQDLQKRKAGGQDLSSELLEGALMIADRQAWIDPAPPVLSRAIAILEDRSAPIERRLEVAFDEELRLAMVGAIHPEHTARHPAFEIWADRPRGVFGAWYELFPRSEGGDATKHGTFGNVEQRLPDLAALGFDVLYFPPIHPIGKQQRKGKNNNPIAQPGEPGSPWAIGSDEGGHMAIHPELGTVEEFRQLVKKAKKLGIDIALDFALQCSPDHPWIHEHPEWFFIRPDGSLRYAENPPRNTKTSIH